MSLQPVRLLIGPNEAEGRIVFADGRLTAALVCLVGRHYQESVEQAIAAVPGVNSVAVNLGLFAGVS